MRIVFWFSLAGILYTYVGYPVVMWMLARIRPRPWKTGPIHPSVGIVLAVHNGALLLPRKIQHLLDLDYPNIQEIILVSDGSTDGTGELLAAEQHPRVKSIVLEQHGGKAVAVNAGLAEATAEVIIFVDIRPEIGPGAIGQLVSNFADEKVGCVSGNLMLRQEGHDAASAAIGGFYWRYEQWIRMCEAVTDSPVGVYGGFYAIRRKLAVRQPDGMILDDMFQPLSIIRQGYRSVVDPAAFVYDTWPKKRWKRISPKSAHACGELSAFPTRAMDAGPEESGSLPTRVAQGDAPRRALPVGADAALFFDSGCPLSPVRFICCASGIGMAIALAGLRGKSSCFWIELRHLPVRFWY